MERRPFEDEERKAQKVLNEAKKRALAEKYGAQFGEGDSRLSPELESQWLNYIEEFERQFENARRVTVREFVGNPKFKPLGEVPPEQLEAELDSVLEFLSLHSIVVDSVADVSEAELYRFITTELMDVETDDIRIDGMMHHFIYEEFHPNDQHDAKMFAEHFLWDLFQRRTEDALRAFSNDEIYDSAGIRLDREEMRRRLNQLYASFVAFPESKHEPLDCSVDGDYAVVRLHSSWSGLQAVSMKQVSHSGVTVLRMKRSPYGGFDVVQANVVGWNF